METQQLTKIFKPLDGGALAEIALITLVVTLLIIGTQRLLPRLANRVPVKARLILLAITPVLRLALIVAAIVMILPRIIEPSLQNMVALLASVGLAIGFALKDYVSSLIAGIVAVGERPYRNGDWIEVNGIYGEVRHIGMRTVQIVTPDDTAVHIPHLKLWTEAILNANNGTPQLQCVADFHLQPDHDAVRVKALLHDVALASPYLHVDLPILVIVQDKPWGTHYRLKAYPIDPRQQFRFITDLTVRGKSALMGLGISFVTTPTLTAPSS